MKLLGLLPLLLVLAACKPPTKPADAPQPPPPSATTADAGRPAGGPPGGGPGGPGGGPGARLERMKADLALSEDQSQKISAVFEEQRPAMQALRDDKSMDRDQRREKMREIRQAADEKISAILTPEQKAKWEELRAKRQNDGPGGGPGGKPKKEGGKHKKDGGAGGGPGAGGPGGPEAAGMGEPPPPPNGE